MKLRAPVSGPSTPSPRRVRRPGLWRPIDEPYVLLACGHEALPWGAIVNLRGTVKACLCETCGDWVKIGRKKHHPKQQEVLDLPPF